jgi:tetratricopeptide (TPR) repeat protein
MKFSPVHRAAAGALLIFASVSLLGQSIDERVQEHFEAAQRAQQAGDLDTAAREYQSAIQLSPHVAELYANLGLVYYAQSKFSDSATALSEAAKLKPGLPGVTLWLGINDVKLGEPAKAVLLLREAVRQNPKDLQGERFYGTALWNSGATFPAIDQLTKTCGMFPSDTDSFFVLSETYRKAADHEMESVLAASTGKPFLHLIYGDIYCEQHAWIRAAAHYREALKQDPAAKGAHLGLGEASLAQNKLSEAEAEFHQELSVDPVSVEAHVRLAEVALLQGKTQAALELLKPAIQRSPYRALAVFEFNRSVGNASDNDIADASQATQAGADLQSAPQSAARSLAQAILDAYLAKPALKDDLEAYEASLPKISAAHNTVEQTEADIALGRFHPAYIELRAWLSAHPNDVTMRYQFARVLKQLCLEAAVHVIDMDPESPRVHQLLGQMYADRREEDKALAQYKLAEQANPSMPDIHYQVGHLEWQFGDRDNALAEYHKELAINPYHAEADDEIGSILLILNQPQDAIPYLEAALRIDPALMMAHQQLGKAYAMLRDYKHAEPELQRASTTDLDGSVYYQLWKVYRAEGKTREAEQAIARCQALRDQNASEAQNQARGTVAP